MPNFFKKIIRKGGLRLKLIGFITLTIIMTVGSLNYFIIKLVKKALSEKTFEIVETSLERISDTSSIALLERTYENKVNLDEVLKEARDAKVSGILDIAVYSSVKSGDELGVTYFTGFDALENTTVHYLSSELADRILTATDDSIFYEPFHFISGRKVIPAYRFVKPILYEYENKSHVLGAVVMAYSEQAMFRAINKVILVSALISGVVLFVSIILTYLLGSRHVRPIITLARAASEVTHGNLDVDINVSTNDEVEVLGDEFKQMVRGLKEREMMQKFVSGSTIDMIRKKSYKDVRLGGEHKTLTFFFSDIRGFTELSEKKDAQDVVAIVNFYFNLQADIIHKWGGDIDKFVGDSVMAVFGGRGSVDRAINAAIEIQNAIGNRNVEREKEGLTTIQVGIGISHGKVVAGNIGSSDRMDFTCMGSAVNLASRLCSKARHAEILINRLAYALSNRKYKIEVIGPMIQKGFHEPIEVLSIGEAEKDSKTRVAGA